MTKEALISKVSEEVNIPKQDVKETLESILNQIIHGVQSGDKINFIGFGSFSVTETKARKGRNPKTGEEINLPASKRVKFTPGSNFKEAVKS